MQREEWFSDWFNTPYYHILYQDRDETEAAKFTENLKSFLNMQPQSKVLDLGCGRGRHALFLNNLGFDVTGIDIAEENIVFAQKFENENLHFFKHDMRKPLRSNYFDFVFNLFSSFGYFKTEKEHADTLKYAGFGLKEDGIMVLDFFNALRIEKSLVKSEVKTVLGIDFHITRTINEGRINKEIHFKEQGHAYYYVETVRLFDRASLSGLLLNAGLEVFAVKGDYDLKDFDAENSPRLILFAKKKKR
jgi:SAM-dependent methyltransferase